MELFLLLGALSIKNNLTSISNNNYNGATVSNNDIFYELPRFWTNTGFCPAGNINRKEISAFLLSESVQMNLRYIAALPYNAITHMRVHWSLELVEFLQYTEAGIPVYDYADLDKFISNMDDLNLYPVIELMGNPGDVFVKNPNRNWFYWQHFSFQLIRRYLNVLGAKKLLQWRFESWNEPDVAHYNRLNFTVEDYLTYLDAIKSGVQAAGRRSVNSLHFPLRGPAGLFKDLTKHPLCWSALERCNVDLKRCPFDVLTYHRKGEGTATQVIEASTLLLKNIFKKYPALQELPCSNDEADPISGWSTPRDFQADVHYANTLVQIVMLHWSSKLSKNEFKNLEIISHDNAFLSYHPYEFTQRTLLAHFRMNETEPVHSQFIQKPVYAALGFLGKLGKQSNNLKIITLPDGQTINLLETVDDSTNPYYFSWLSTSRESDTTVSKFSFERALFLDKRNMESFAYIIETLEHKVSDPAHIWQTYNRPPYPNSTVREIMRRHQTPILQSTGRLNKTSAVKFKFEFNDLQSPWVMLTRVCSNFVKPLQKVANLIITAITHGEVLITWQEQSQTSCLKTYEVWYQNIVTANWTLISKNWHLPFPSYHFAPVDAQQVNGLYKVCGVDIFNEKSEFSDILEYIEI